MSQWSALIYGRTYEVDFRMLAMPDYFSDRDKQWAIEYILATTDRPERLLNSPRWSLFNNGKYCAIGITCAVNYLAADSRYQQDFKARSLYAFVGYVARLQANGRFPPLPQYGDLDLAEFARTYDRYICQCWFVKSYESSSKQPILTRASESNIDFDGLQKHLVIDRFTCNLDRNYKGIYPEEHRSLIWNSAVLEIAEPSDRECSLALGLSPGKELNNSPFLNLTLPNLDFATTIEATHKESRAKISRDAIIPLAPARERELDRPSESDRLFAEYLGAIAVGTVVGVFFPTLSIGTIAPIWSVAPSLLLGSTLGILGIGCIANRSVGGRLRKRIVRLLTNSVDRGDRQHDLPQHRQQHKNLGFKEVDRQTDRRDWY